MPLVQTFGERLKGILQALGLMDKQVAAEMGISTQSFSRYVGTNRVPKHATLQRIAAAISSLTGEAFSVDRLLADVSVSYPDTVTNKTRAQAKEARVSDPMAAIRWEWEQLDQDDQIQALHQMQDVLRSFTSGASRRGRDAR